MSSNVGKRINILFILVVDLGILFSSYLLAFLARFPNNIPSFNINPFWAVAPWIGLAAIVVFFLFDLYSPSIRKPLHNIVYSVALSVFLLTTTLIALSFWVRGFSLPRSVILLGLLFHLMLMLVFRVSIWYLSYKFHGKKNVLIVGNNLESAMKITEKILSHPSGWYSFYRFVFSKERKNIRRWISSVDVVMLISDLSIEEKTELIRLCTRHQKEVIIVPDLYELYLKGSEAQQVDDMLVFSIAPPTLSQTQRMIKRLLDLLVSITLIIIFSPIIAILLFLVPLTSKGKAIFKQERLGKDGKPYMIYKFRSMVEDAEASTGPVLATDKDPRVTPFGHILRATRLDELPQLYNVLKGDMSLVGPRPERAHFIDKFKGEIPDYTYRMMVKPGITGLAQVMSNYSTDAEDKLRYDLMYINNYSFILDIKIILLTILVVLKRDQSKGVKSEVSKSQKEILKAMDL